MGGRSGQVESPTSYASSSAEDPIPWHQVFIRQFVQTAQLAINPEVHRRCDVAPTIRFCETQSAIQCLRVSLNKILEAALGQGSISFAPHFAQNFRKSRFSVWHLEHFISLTSV